MESGSDDEQKDTDRSEDIVWTRDWSMSYVWRVVTYAFTQRELGYSLEEVEYLHRIKWRNKLGNLSYLLLVLLIKCPNKWKNGIRIRWWTERHRQVRRYCVNKRLIHVICMIPISTSLALDILEDIYVLSPLLHRIKTNVINTLLATVLSLSAHFLKTYKAASSFVSFV